MKSKNVILCRSLSGAVCTGTILLLASSASGQNVFVSNYSTDDIYEITPGGGQSVFASGMDYPAGIAFNSAGDLFVANSANNDGDEGYITEITPGGAQSTFASGIDPQGLAINSTGDVFVEDYSSGNIYEYTPGGVRSIFATGFANPISLAINSMGDLFVGAGYGNGNGYITEITPNGIQIPFASGLSFPGWMAFNSAGDMLMTEQAGSNIYEYTPGGVQSIYAPLNDTQGLAVDSAGDVFIAAEEGHILEIAVNGTQTTIATESGIPDSLALQPVPEPSALGLMGAGAVIFFACRHKRKSNAVRV